MIYFRRPLFPILMSTNLFRPFAVVLLLCVLSGSASAEPFFHSTDPLAPRDEWGLLHQTSTLSSADFLHRHPYRSDYYFISGRALLTDPAYVAALQVCLHSRGYYCGPVDGVMSEDVTDAIARMQKNYAQRVTGRLTPAVRRALRLP